MGTHPIFESDFDCLTDRSSSRTFERKTNIHLKSHLSRSTDRCRQREMVEEFEDQSRTGSNGENGCDDFGSRPKTIDCSSSRAGNVFNSFTSREKGEDRKIPRQAHPIQRKEIENSGVRKRS